MEKDFWQIGKWLYARKDFWLNDFILDKNLGEMVLWKRIWLNDFIMEKDFW